MKMITASLFMLHHFYTIVAASTKKKNGGISVHPSRRTVEKKGWKLLLVTLIVASLFFCVRAAVFGTIP